MTILAFACSLTSCILAVLLMKYPRRVIEFQIGVFLLSNWKLEPMSWDNEIKRMTKIGMLLAVVSFLGFINYLSLLQLSY